MPKLSDVLKNRYTAWRTDVPATWQPPLQGVEPDFAGVPTTTTLGASIAIFPRLKSDPLTGAAPGASVLRALDRVAFSNVRVVLMGQDPYPRKRQATGRAFEQGSWKKWNATSATDKVPASFRRVIQRLAEFRTNDNSYLTSWTKITSAVATGALPLAAPTALYDGWENQGVMFLNRVLTYTMPAHVETCHGVFWRPIVERILEKLVQRPTACTVFALWGTEAQSLQPFIQTKATAAGAWNTRVKAVTSNHPATNLFFKGPNPFKNINDVLAAVGGGAPITW